MSYCFELPAEATKEYHPLIPDSLPSMLYYMREAKQIEEVVTQVLLFSNT
jgi:hypothetical protein